MRFLATGLTLLAACACHQKSRGPEYPPPPPFSWVVPTGNSEVWGYIIEEPPWKAGGPPTPVADLIIESSGPRFVYRFHAHYPPWGPKTPDRGRAMADRPPLLSAAGFDGKVYWMATFLRLPPEPGGDRFSWQAWTIDLWSPDALKGSMRPPIREYRPGDGHGMSPDGRRYYARDLQPWLIHAPLHNMLRFLGCSALDEATLRAAMKKHFVTKTKDGRFKVVPQVRPGQEGMPPHWLTCDPDPFEHVIEVDSSRPAIKTVEINWPTMFTGSWPYPVPFRYRILRANSMKTHPRVFGYEEYRDEETEILRH